MRSVNSLKKYIIITHLFSWINVVGHKRLNTVEGFSSLGRVVDEIQHRGNLWPAGESNTSRLEQHDTTYSLDKRASRLSEGFHYLLEAESLAAASVASDTSGVDSLWYRRGEQLERDCRYTSLDTTVCVYSIYGEARVSVKGRKVVLISEQRDQIGTNFSFTAPSSEEINKRTTKTK